MSAQQREGTTYFSFFGTAVKLCSAQSLFIHGLCEDENYISEVKLINQSSKWRKIALCLFQGFALFLTLEQEKVWVRKIWKDEDFIHA